MLTNLCRHDFAHCTNICDFIEWMRASTQTDLSDSVFRSFWGDLLLRHSLLGDSTHLRPTLRWETPPHLTSTKQSITLNVSPVGSFWGPYWEAAGHNNCICGRKKWDFSFYFYKRWFWVKRPFHFGGTARPTGQKTNT